jgi:hypothetical protein
MVHHQEQGEPDGPSRACPRRPQHVQRRHEAHHTTEAAIRRCVAIVREHGPEGDGPEARKLVVRMLAEEPIC